MYDVAIIGGGVSGCSLLYALSRYRLRVVLLEKTNDVGVGTTKANSAIVHAGYDPEPGTLMAKYNVEGNAIIRQMCTDLDILYKQTGSLVLAFEEADKATLQKLYQNGLANGVPGLRIVEQDELRRMEPNISSEAHSALYAPTGGVVNPWELAFAQAEAAIQGGAEVRLDNEVTAIAREKGGFTLTLQDTSQQALTTGNPQQSTLKARFVVNAAGTHADTVEKMLHTPAYRILPNRGQYFLLDTTQGQQVSHVIFQCPTKQGKGVLVSPTVHGNLIVGPDNCPVTPEDTATTAEELALVRQAAVRSVPGIDFRETIRNFAGVRAASTSYDFIVGPVEDVEGYFTIAGIKSPGLTAAPAIALDMVRMLADAGLALTPNPNFVSQRRVTRFAELNTQEKDEIIRKNPLYGVIVCRCKTITEGEIVAALHRPLPPRSLDAVKRRCNAGMGRCQSGFCGPRVQAIIARELDIPMQDVPLDRAGMNIITGNTKEANQL